MKAIFKLSTLMLCMLMFFGLFSCQKKTDDVKASGKLQITLSGLKELSGLKSARADSINNNDTVHFSSYHLLLSVTGINGEYVLEDKLIPVYGFGSAFVSVQIEMNAGEYFLKKFMVLNNSGQVMYASPLEGSSRAYLVNQPLPLYFAVNPDQTTQISPEVLPVEGFIPSDFGYVSFIAQLVNPLVFYVKLQYNPLSMAPYFTGKSVLNVYTSDGWWHSFNIDTIATKIEVRASEYYEMVVYTESYPEFRLSLAANELRGTSQGNPYIIKTGTQSSNILILQPGPDEGMDARISDIEPDVNFGNYMYFESTFLSDSFLTVMRTTCSLVSFDLNQLPKSASIKNVILTLYYDIPIPWEYDSSWFTYRMNCNCLFYGASLQQVIEPWEEDAVTWNNQPLTTGFNQVYLYPFIKNANVIDVDVTSIFVPNPYIDNIPFPNYGMMLKLNPDETFPGFRFVSSDYPDAYMRPKLTIYYSLPDDGAYK